MSKPLILITSISGRIGFRVLMEAIKAQHRVRGIVRNANQRSLILNTLTKRLPFKNIEIVLIPDLTRDDAFTPEIMEGVTFVIHPAAPPMKESDNYERDLFQPTLGMTSSIMKAAARTPSVKRVVITGTIGSLLSSAEMRMGKFTTVYTANIPLTAHDLKLHYAHAGSAFLAVKTNALIAAEEFMANENPKYDLVLLLSSRVVGRVDLASKPGDLLSMHQVLRLVSGSSEHMYELGSSVHHDDVASAHIAALDPAVPARRYILAGDAVKGVEWMDAVEILRNTFPEHWGKELSVGGKISSMLVKFDVSDTEVQLRMRFQSLETQVTDLVAQYLEMLSGER